MRWFKRFRMRKLKNRGYELLEQLKEKHYIDEYVDLMTALTQEVNLKEKINKYSLLVA